MRQREPRPRAGRLWHSEGFGSLSKCDGKSLEGFEQGTGIIQPLAQVAHMCVLVPKRQMSEKILNVSAQTYHHSFHVFIFYPN